MAKNSSQQIHRDEIKVLKLLETDAKESIDRLAKKSGFSRQKVWRIMKKLDREKIIWGYTAIADNDYLNMKHFTMLIKRSTRPINEKIKNEILNTRLDDLLPPGKIHIEDIKYVHGCFDGIFSFQADSIVTAKQFVERFNEHFKEFVSEIHLLETIVPIRRQSIRNPRLKEVLTYL